jgi:hypothetical protein
MSVFAETLADSWFPESGNKKKRKIDRPKPQSFRKEIQSFLFF